MDKIKQYLQSERVKKIAPFALGAVLALWVIYRFASIAIEGHRDVFNAARMATDDGLPVDVVVVNRARGDMYTPLAVKGNRAVVSASRINKFKVGDRIDNGAIESVSHSIDLDTGMYVIRTRGVSDGTHMVKSAHDGYFVPLYAVSGNSVMVVVDGKAARRDVVVSRTDADNALITSGLSDGDAVILSNVTDGQKVSIK